MSQLSLNLDINGTEAFSQGEFDPREPQAQVPSNEGISTSKKHDTFPPGNADSNKPSDFQPCPGNQNATTAESELNENDLAKSSPEDPVNTLHENEEKPKPQLPSNLIGDENSKVIGRADSVPSSASPSILASSDECSEEASEILSSENPPSQQPQSPSSQDEGLFEVADSRSSALNLPQSITHYNPFAPSNEERSDEPLESPSFKTSPPQQFRFPPVRDNLVEVADSRDQHITLNINLNSEVRLDELPETPRFGNSHIQQVQFLDLESESILISLCLILSAITMIHFFNYYSDDRL